MKRKLEELGAFTEENIEKIETKIREITGESKLRLEEHFDTSKGRYFLTFGSNHAYDGTKWNKSAKEIKEYTENLYEGYRAQVREGENNKEARLPVSVVLTGKLH